MHFNRIHFKHSHISNIRTIFNKEILPTIKESLVPTGRPLKISHYIVFSAILYVLRTGTSCRDIPTKYLEGYSWHTIYTRFARGNEKNIWWNILLNLQNKKKLTMDIVICDSSTFKVHRHGGGQKKGSKQKEEVLQE
ncbi:MAG: transposase [Rickettsiales bacterium]|nr:transposase [Rickettsiales bacterium]